MSQLRSPAATSAAVPGTGASFAGWYGDVPEAVRTCAAITVAVGAASWIMPRFTRPWTYDGTSGTMTDGKWTLNVEKNSDGATTLTAGRGARCGLFATTGSVFFSPGTLVVASSQMFNVNTSQDSILTAVDAQAGGKDCVICASQAFPQWCAGAGLVSALSSEEAEIAPEGAFGVYRAGLAAPFGKAWVVNRKSAYEPRATTVIIR